MDIKYLKGIGDKRAEAFKKIGIESLSDFISLKPRAYVKKESVKNLREFQQQLVWILGRVTDVQYPRRTNQPTVVYFSDSTGSIEIPIFGKSEFRSKQFRIGESYVFLGKPTMAFDYRGFALEYKDHIKINLSDEAERGFLKFEYLPIYELSEVLKKTFIKPLSLSKIVYYAMRTLVKENSEVFREILNENLLKANNLISREEAIKRINFPRKFEDIEIARRRLAYDELFFKQMIFALKRVNLKREIKYVSISVDIKELTEKFLKCIDFELTGAQKKVINEIYSDMKSKKVMNRLLQGDVGSGKTIVAIFCMLIAVESGYQAALMCPTELLSEQHYSTIKNFINRYNQVSSKDIEVVLLRGKQNKKLRNNLLTKIKDGSANIIIGTHALIQEKVEYKNLGFAIIDEQHKFGVLQRAKLKEKGLNPDVLVMTATPIPRTLSLTVYGDLDVSKIDEMPMNRKPVRTKIMSDNEKGKVYSFVREEVSKGRQVYFIYPLIDESEKLDLKSTETNYDYLKNSVFPDLKVGMIHGRVLSFEKDDTMNDFVSNKINILVSTTVIEVGIDVPNASVMIIEDAHRFGLSQLHQLRGRVGRGSEQSYCILITKVNDPISRRRLQVMQTSNDGFLIAETDMDIRGPGDFFGTRQSGEMKFIYTDFTKDKSMLEIARNNAFNAIKDDPQLRKPENQSIKKYFLLNFKNSLSLMKIA